MNEKYNIQIVLTNDKTINLCLDSKYAPNTVENFINLVKKNYFDGTIFHRVIDNFMIQTGGYYLEDMTIKELPEVAPIKGEFSANGFMDNTLKHELGVISMARTNVMDSATSQFFICSATCPHLDGQYAAFGYAVDEESKKNILEISKMPTGYINPMFSDFPFEVIGIKTIKLL